MAEHFISYSSLNGFQCTELLLTSIHGPLAAQSRDDPEPYSLPAKIITGILVLMYFWAASNMSIWTHKHFTTCTRISLILCWDGRPWRWGLLMWETGRQLGHYGDHPRPQVADSGKPSKVDKRVAPDRSGMVMCLKQMICIWPSWCHCQPIISCFINIQNGLPFWCWLT